MRTFTPLLLLILPAALAAQDAADSLPAPTGLEASDDAYSTKVGLSWEHVQGAKSYRLLRAETDNPSAAVSVGTTPSIIFYDRTARPGQTFFYWVQAEAGALRSGFSAPDAGRRAIGKNSAFGKIEPLEPPVAPLQNPVTGAKVYLGKTLFWDEQLSSTRTLACGSCHLPRKGGADPRPGAATARSLNPGRNGRFGDKDDVRGSPGVVRNRADGAYLWSQDFGLREQVTGRKANSMIDAAYADVGLFWDGRAQREFLDPITGEVVFTDAAPLERQALESQALDPFLSDVEMAHDGRTLDEVIRRIVESRPLALSPSVPAALAVWIGGRDYTALFEEAFGTPQVTPVRIAMAIASYERTLYSDRTLIDQVVSAIIESPPAVERGRRLFFDNFCDECHRGGLIGDNRFHYIGVRPASEDIGRSKVTRSGLDKGRMRTPSLRNVMLRAPYMHTGRFAAIEDALEFYNRGGDFDSPIKDTNFVRKMKLTDTEKSDFLAFFGALTDPRVAAEAGPLFDRPMLYTESARAPQILGSGSPIGAVVPQVVALEPPLAGNPNFTVGLYDAPAGRDAVLVIDEQDPGLGPRTPATASFFRGSATTAPEGYASITLAIPDDPALVGRTLWGRWFVPAGSGTGVTPAFRMTVFAPPNPPAEISALSSVSAASLAMGFVAPESIVSGFGGGLSELTQKAEILPLPTTLGGVSLTVTDAAGRERRAPLFFVSPAQINYLVPAGTAAGEAIVSVRRLGSVIATGMLQVAATAPTLFSANSNGRGVAAALVLRVKPDGTQSYEPVARFDLAQSRFIAKTIDFGPTGDELFVILFGSGLRFADTASITATVGGEPAEILFAGAHPELAGLDQINLRLPRPLAGRGDIEVKIQAAERTANAVTLRF